MMIYKTTAKIVAALVAAVLVLVLPGAPCAYAAPLAPADDQIQAISSINLANAAVAQQQAESVAVRGKAFILWTAVIALLAVGFIVVFNIQHARR